MDTLNYHYETMGRILAHLLPLGIGRTDFEPTDIFEIMSDRRGDEDEVVSTFADVMHWMIDEGIVRVASCEEYEGGFFFGGVQLTSKGIHILRAQTDDPELGNSIEELVSRNRPSDIDTGIYAKIGDFVGGALGGFTKSLGS